MTKIDMDGQVMMRNEDGTYNVVNADPERQRQLTIENIVDIHMLNAELPNDFFEPLARKSLERDHRALKQYNKKCYKINMHCAKKLRVQGCYDVAEKYERRANEFYTPNLLERLLLSVNKF